jgi:hypothetical protein
MAELEALDLGLDPRRLDAPRHLAQQVRGGEKRAIAEIERAAIEGADLGPKLFDMGDALGRAGHISSRPARGRMGGIEEKIAAHAGGEIDDDVGAR